jgi:hypothetical protein
VQRRLLIAFYSILTLWAISPALAIETRFGETSEPESDNLQKWWKKDHEARLLLKPDLFLKQRPHLKKP